MPIRTFIALELSAPLRGRILELIEQMRGMGVRASWARDSTLHMTIKFLGDVEEAAMSDVVSAVQAAAARVPCFAFTSCSIGAFPSARRPRVLWIGVEADGELLELASGVEAELARAGFPKERRPFRPHVTFGRIRDTTQEGAASRALSELTAPVERVVVREVRVMRSTLGRGGAVHEIVAAAPLGAPGEQSVAGGV